MRQNYLNLTNGVEAIDVDDYITSLPDLVNVRFIRIQSCTCERKMWSKLIQEIDYDYLMNYILGNEIHVYDFSPKKTVSRALYQGVPTITYLLNKHIHGVDTETWINCHNVTGYIEYVYNEMKREDGLAIRKLDYIKKMNFLDIKEYKKPVIHCMPTKLDGNYEAQKTILSKLSSRYPQVVPAPGVACYA